MLTVTEAAKRLGVSNETIYNWYKMGKIDIHFVSQKRRYVSIESIEKIESEKIPDDMKRCSQCGIIDREDSDIWIYSHCKECVSQKKRKYRQDKSGRIKARKREYYQENKELIKSKSKSAYQKDPNSGKARALKRYYAKKRGNIDGQAA